jgi:hypothetical protein
LPAGHARLLYQLWLDSYLRRAICGLTGGVVAYRGGLYIGTTNERPKLCWDKSEAAMSGVVFTTTTRGSGSRQRNTSHSINQLHPFQFHKLQSVSVSDSARHPVTNRFTSSGAPDLTISSSPKATVGRLFQMWPESQSGWKHRGNYVIAGSVLSTNCSHPVTLPKLQTGYPIAPWLDYCRIQG